MYETSAKSENIRVIPRLDIKGPNVVKGIQLEGLRVVGRPELFAPKYYEEGADEILYLDSVASLYGRNNLEEIIRRAAEKIYIPMTVGGGIRCLDDIKRLLRAGADKVAINTGVIKNPHLITEGASRFGSQCIVVSIAARKTAEGWYECLTDNAREKTGINVLDWVEQAVKAGAGEILLTAVNNEGMGKGYDLELTRTVAGMVNIPVIASGGAGDVNHVSDVVREGNADAVCMASILHYGLLDLMKEGAYDQEGNTDFLSQKRSEHYGRKGIHPTTIPELKKHLRSQGISCCINGRLEHS